MTESPHIKALLAVLGASALSAPVGCAARPPPVLAVRFADGPVAIDGVPDEPGWRRAECLMLGRGRVVGRGRAMWDRDFLYVTVACPLADRISPDALILRVTGARRVHVKFEPDGNCWDLRSASARSAVIAPHLLTYATYLNGKRRWTVEAGIPLTAFGAVGAPVTLHLARIGAHTPPSAGAPAEPVQSECTRRLDFRPPAAPSRPAGRR